MNWNLLRTSVVLTTACLCVGCGGSDYPAVSGTVTYEGKPLANVQLVFNPVSDSTEAVAPYSVAVTDETGAFSLETRDGQLGAMVGLHQVGFAWSDIKSYTIRDLEQLRRELKDDPAAAAKVEAKIANAKQKLASRPTLKAGLQTEFTVPDGGSDSVSFELTDF